MSKYRYNIYDDVREYVKENFGEDITDEDIDKMSRDDVLRYWLEWNGIIGYTSYILNIVDSSETYSKRDVINAINDYIEVLKHDVKRDSDGVEDGTINFVLNNVINSLTEIVSDLNK